MGRMGRWARRSLLVAMAALVAALAVIAPRIAYAAEAEVNSFDEFVNTLESAPGDESLTVTLAGNITATDNVTLAANTAIVLDLNGFTVNMAEHSMRMGIGSTLAIRDGSQNGGGAISGTGSYTIQTRIG